MSTKSTYTFIYDIKEVKNVLKIDKKIDNVVIAINMQKKLIVVKDIKRNKKYKAKIFKGIKGETIIENFEEYINNNKTKKITDNNIKKVTELIPEYVLDIIDLFDTVNGYYIFKILYPIKVYTKEEKEIQLDIFMLWFNNKVFFLVEPVDFLNEGNIITEDIHDIIINKYMILDKTKDEIDNMDTNFFTEKRKKYKYFDILYIKLIGVKKYNQYINRYFQKFFPYDIEVEEMVLYDFLSYFYKLEYVSYNFINNIFSTEDNFKSTKNNLELNDYIDFEDKNKVNRIITPYYNISIYKEFEDMDNYFIKNTLEGFLILNIFNSYQDIVSNDDINPSSLKKDKNIIDVSAYIMNNPYLYAFYEEIIKLKQFKRLEYEFDKKLNYAQAVFDEKILKAQKLNNRLIIILTIVSLIIGIISIYVSIKTS